MKKRKKDSKRAKPIKGAELVGYARVSTAMQELETQLSMLREYGCHKIYVDKMSGKTTSREGWHDCWRYLREGDTLVFYDLSRIGRDTMDLLRIERELYVRGIKMHSLTEVINTTTKDGRLFFTMKAAFAQFERQSTIDRTAANIAWRREQGAKIGRPSAVTDQMRVKIKKDLKAKGKHGKPKYTVKQIWEKYGLSKQQFMYAFPGGRQGRK